MRPDLWDTHLFCLLSTSVGAVGTLHEACMRADLWDTHILCLLSASVGAVGSLTHSVPLPLPTVMC